MTFRLVFDQGRIPRTTTRAEWRKIDRWRRTTMRTIRESEEGLRNGLVAFGSVKIAERLINPPIMIYP